MINSQQPDDHAKVPHLKHIFPLSVRKRYCVSSLILLSTVEHDRWQHRLRI